jgi:hypothetical protein
MEIRETKICEVAVVRREERAICTLTWRYHADRSYSIELEMPDQTLQAVGYDLVDALRGVRKQLERLGWLLAVQGARRDAYASGMIRDMIGGRETYLIQLGRQVSGDHLVDLLSESDVGALATVEEQEDFYRIWRESVRARPDVRPGA